MEGNTSFKRAVPGFGSIHRQPGKKRIVIAFDDETFDEVRDRAVKAGTSFAEQVRMLVEWGLLSEEEAAHDR